MKILIVTASKHGSTTEIARILGEELTARGHQATLADAGEPVEVAPFEAVVLGSSIYAGHWRKPARRFVDHHRAELQARPLWLFSSGPLGEAPKPGDEPVEVAEVLESTGAREHHLFGGKLDKEDLNIGERAILKAVKVPFGDFRDWDDVRAWAAAISGALDGASPTIRDRS